MSKRPAGTVHINNDVLADLVGYSALESYGVVGMASPTLVDGVFKLLPAQKLRKGVVITGAEDSVELDLYVVLEHGTNLTEVSHNLANTARYVLNQMADVAVSRADVHVMGIKVRQAR